MSTKVAIEIKGLKKRYDDKTVVNDVSLEIVKGECFGLLGPNGAGKSTTMKTMYCSAQFTEGEIYVLGLNVKKNYQEIKSRIGVVPQEDGLDPDFTVFENLLLFSRYHGMDPMLADKRIRELIHELRLEEFRNRNVETLSGGIRRRVAIARGLINNPELVILDEPTTGLDPQARFFMWDTIRNLRQDGHTVVLTTHYMEEAEALCDRVAIMDEGKILAIDNPAKLIEEYIGVEVVEFETTNVDMAYYLGRLKQNNYRYQVIKNTVSVHISRGQEGRGVMEIVTSPKITIRKPTLNDVFLTISGHDLRDE